MTDGLSAKSTEFSTNIEHIAARTHADYQPCQLRGRGGSNVVFDRVGRVKNNGRCSVTISTQAKFVVTGGKAGAPRTDCGCINVRV